MMNDDEALAFPTILDLALSCSDFRDIRPVKDAEAFQAVWLPPGEP